MTEVGGLVFDASALIDYGNCAPEVLSLVALHLAPVCVPDLVFAEVDCLTIEDAAGLGVDVVETSANHMAEANARPRNLSFEDYLCFLLARDEGLVCVTGDGALHRHCVKNGTAAVRGLRPLLDLAHLGVLSLSRSLRIARTIESQNDWMTREVVMTVAIELLSIRAERRARG